MDINRTHYFLAGIVILVLGIQFRLVQAVVLNEEISRALVKQMQKSEVASTSFFPSLYASVAPPTRKTVTPPKWLGWALTSTGAVLVLHSLAMPKPAG